MNLSERELLDRLTAISGVHPKIVDFAVFNGFRVVADQTFEEQLRVIGVRYGLSRRESLDLLADDFRDALAEFYADVFPVVTRSRK